MVADQKNMRLFAIILLACLAGCGIPAKPYHNRHTDNLVIRLADNTEKDVNYHMEVYSLDAKCQGDYQGTVYVKKQSVTTGIPAGKPSLLTFNFSKFSWLRNASSNVAVDALLNPGRDFRYEVELSYVSSMYDVKLYKSNSKTGKKSKLNIVGLEACQQQ